MENERTIKRYSADELRAKRARGESRSDFARLDAMSEEEIERNAAADTDSQLPANWFAAAEAVMPTPKRPLTLRLDVDVVDWFRAGGSGYQTRMNAVLRAFVEQQEKRRA